MLKDWLKITEDPAEIVELGKRLAEEITINTGGCIRKFYTPLMLSKMLEEIGHYAPETTLEEREELRWKFIYDYWVYGNNVDEEFIRNNINELYENLLLKDQFEWMPKKDY